MLLTTLNWSLQAKKRLKKCWQLFWLMVIASQNTSRNMFLAGWCVFCCRQQEFANKPWDSPDITIKLAPLFLEGHTTDLLVRFFGLNQALTAVCTDCLCENFYWKSRHFGKCCKPQRYALSFAWIYAWNVYTICIEFQCVWIKWERSICSPITSRNVSKWTPAPTHSTGRGHNFL